MKKETLNAVLKAHAKARKAAERYRAAGVVERFGAGEHPSDDTVEYIAAQIEAIEVSNKTLPEIRKFLKGLAVSDAELYRALHYYILEGVPLIDACKKVDKINYRFILKRALNVLNTLK